SFDVAVLEHTADGVDKVVAFVERGNDHGDGSGHSYTRLIMERARSCISAIATSERPSTRAAFSTGIAANSSTFVTPSERRRPARTSPILGTFVTGRVRPRSTSNTTGSKIPPPGARVKGSGVKTG